MSRKKEFRILEKRILENNHGKQENEIVLENNDFRDGKLSWAGFSRLKDECQYVDYKDDIEIKVPRTQHINSFKDTLETMAVNELKHIKKDIRENRIKAIVLFIVGAAILAIGLSIDVPGLRQELMFIFSWVLIWASTEKTIFDRNSLKDNRYNLLHILSANVTSINEPEISNNIETI